MAYGISIHIGLNEIDPAHYGTGHSLKGCINDANAMLQIAKSKGFEESYLLTDKEATHKNLITHLQKAARKLKKEDFLFISFAGHGASVWDNNEDESDGKDETWCLYDRMILDDELAALWTAFKPGVRILMVSDSCHSGSVSREMRADGELIETKSSVGNRGLEEGPEIYERNRAIYEATMPIEKNIAKGSSIEATVLLLSGCQDNQTSLDGIEHGFFTEKLLLTYNNGIFTGNYAGLLLKILKQMPSIQTPGITVIGKRNAPFETAAPFEK